MDGLQARMEEARALFRNPETTEFVIVTIPTVMAAAESARLAKALRTEQVPVKSILINQVGSLFLRVRLPQRPAALHALTRRPGHGACA